jgi:hypothetical protein
METSAIHSCCACLLHAGIRLTFSAGAQTSELDSDKAQQVKATVEKAALIKPRGVLL